MNKENKYIKEFRKKFGQEDGEFKGCWAEVPLYVRDVENFILKSLSSQRKEIIEKIEKMEDLVLNDEEGDYYYVNRSKIINLIKEDE